MSKLVGHKAWIKRHFEPGTHKLTKAKLVDLINKNELAGQVIDGEPFLYSDIIKAPAANTPTGIDPSKYFNLSA